MEYDTLSSNDGLFSDGDEDVDYEDLDTTSLDGQTADDARFRIEWSQKLLITNRVLTIVHIFLNIRLIMFAWTLYSVMGRFFVMLPLALEALFSLVFEAVGSQAFWMGRRTTFRRCTACKFSASAFYLVQTVWTIVLLVVTSKVLRVLTFERAPINSVNVDWAWLWSAFSAFAALSAFNILTSLLLIATIIAHWWMTSKTIPEYDGLRPKRSKFAQVSYLITVFGYFLLICAALVMIGMAAGSAINLSGKFGRPNASSYSDCDPIDPTACAYPFPSSFHLRSDPTSPTNVRVNFGSKTLPKTMDGGRIAPTYWNEMDGFSTISPILFYLPDATNASFIPHTNISAYTDVGASTIIMNIMTRERVPHWTELDTVDPSQPSIIIQPAVPLKHSSRYIVIVRNIRNTKGQLISRSPAFDALMNPAGTSTPTDPSRRQLYQDQLIPVMQTAGIDTNEVQLAWDFTTVSAETNHGRFEAMRAIAMNFVPDLDIIKDQEYTCSPTNGISRSITARLTVPNFLAKKLKRGGFLPRSNGVRAPVVQNGLSSTYVLIRVPCSITQPEAPQKASIVVQYGHGLFGDRNEVAAGWISKWLDKTKMMFFASDWYGMSVFDQLQIVRIILSDPSQFAVIPESTLQGWANNIVIYKAMQSGPLANYLQTGGVSLIDSSSKISFYGISQGGVVGGGYVASSPFIQRAALGVPGSPFALLLSRSHDFDAFHALFNLNFYGWRDIRLTLSLMQQLWDQGESAGWLDYMNKDTPSGVPKKQVLIQDAHGDAQVTILAARIMARCFNATNISPSIEPIYGLSEAPSVNGFSGLTEWAYDNVPPMPFDNIPPKASTDTHECIRDEADAQAQIVHFLSSGIISQTCNGPCRKPTCAWLEKHHPKDVVSLEATDNSQDFPEEAREGRFLAGLTDYLPAAK